MRGRLAKGFDTAKDLLVDLLKVKDKQSDNKSMSTLINCVVKVLSNVHETVTNHGKEIKHIIEEITNEKSQRDTLVAELQQKILIRN